MHNGVSQERRIAMGRQITRVARLALTTALLVSTLPACSRTNSPNASPVTTRPTSVPAGAATDTARAQPTVPPVAPATTAPTAPPPATSRINDSALTGRIVFD